MLNYFSVTLAEQVSATSEGSAIVLCCTAVLLGVLIRALTRNSRIGCGVGGGLAAAVLAVYWIRAELLENLLPDIMKQLSLFERFYTFVDGVFDVTALVFYGSVIALGLFLTVQSLEKRRYN